MECKPLAKTPWRKTSPRGFRERDVIKNDVKSFNNVPVPHYQRLQILHQWLCAVIAPHVNKGREWCRMPCLPLEVIPLTGEMSRSDKGVAASARGRWQCKALTDEVEFKKIYSFNTRNKQHLIHRKRSPFSSRRRRRGKHKATIIAQ